MTIYAYFSHIIFNDMAGSFIVFSMQKSTHIFAIPKNFSIFALYLL